MSSEILKVPAPETVSERVLQAYKLAETAHKDQFRSSGEPYITHPLAVYNIVKSYFGINDEDLECAALLHDVCEDTDVSLDQIEKQFGGRVRYLVDGVSKFRSSGGNGSGEKLSQKVVSRSEIEPYVLILKLADRLHNTRTLGFVSPDKQKAKAMETLMVYAPLAESLGMWEVKTELEDLAFSYTDPEGYRKAKDLCDQDPRLEKDFVESYKRFLEGLLKETGITGSVEVRKNSLWTLTEKSRKAAILGKGFPGSFKDIGDLVSLRVVIGNGKDDVGECYRFWGFLGIELGELVNSERSDDFIAQKRDNGYSALHHTLELKEGALEIAVMTKGMEEFNRWGVASILRHGREMDISDYALKVVFTPAGEVRFLPKGAKVIDFAYQLNSKLGAEAEYALVDGERVGLTEELKSGTSVRIVPCFYPRLAPRNAERLMTISLSRTRRAIKDQLIIYKRQEFVEKGKERIDPIIRSRGLLDLEDVRELVLPWITDFGCISLDDLYFKFGEGRITSSQIIEKFDLIGIVKNWTSICADGTDQPGVVNELSSQISQMGGNIERLISRSTNNHYRIRALVRGLSSEQEEKLKAFLAQDRRFTRWDLV